MPANTTSAYRQPPWPLLVQGIVLAFTYAILTSILLALGSWAGLASNCRTLQPKLIFGACGGFTFGLREHSHTQTCTPNYGQQRAVTMECKAGVDIGSECERTCNPTPEEQEQKQGPGQKQEQWVSETGSAYLPSTSTSDKQVPRSRLKKRTKGSST
jgi:hypothetical protein